MFLGTDRKIWILAGVLILAGFAAIATSRILVGILLLGVGLVIFGTSPSGPKREKPKPVAPAAASAPPPPAAPIAPPARKPLDIEAGDPTQV